MKKYHELLEDIMTNGEQREDRTGTGTLSVFGRQIRYDMNQGLPLITTKKVYFKGLLHELLWFLDGDINIKYLKDNKVNIWNEWATEDGNLGPVYGKQWRFWPGENGELIDQIKKLENDLRTNPFSRRHIVSSWNVADLPDESISPQENALNDKMALPPCHTLFQFYRTKNKLHLHLYMRSNDVFLGHPFNIAQYSVFLMMMANVLGVEAGDFIWSAGDAHIYLNHLDQVKELLTREERPLPSLTFKRRPESILDYKYDDFILTGYDPHPAIKAPVAI